MTVCRRLLPQARKKIELVKRFNLARLVRCNPRIRYLELPSDDRRDAGVVLDASCVEGLQDALVVSECMAVDLSAADDDADLVDLFGRFVRDAEPLGDDIWRLDKTIALFQDER